jgi:hypothetical protein
MTRIERGFWVRCRSCRSDLSVEVHVFVLMHNHYHPLVRTTEANLSHALRWLNVSYAVKFNRAHRCHGTMFQGRFKSVVDPGAEQGCGSGALYPFESGADRRTGIEQERSAQGAGDGMRGAGAGTGEARLATLREHPWSSWRIHTGMEPNTGWLETAVMSRACGGRSVAERRAALKA